MRHVWKSKGVWLWACAKSVNAWRFACLSITSFPNSPLTDYWFLTESSSCWASYANRGRRRRKVPAELWHLFDTEPRRVPSMQFTLTDNDVTWAAGQLVDGRRPLSESKTGTLAITLEARHFYLNWTSQITTILPCLFHTFSHGVDATRAKVAALSGRSKRWKVLSKGMLMNLILE